MAKRKRLTAANPLFADGPAPETKSAIPPIAGVAAEAASVSALRELSDTLAEARASGRMVLQVPLDRIALDHLVRDRAGSGDEDMAALIASIRARGQQTPVELMELPDGSYGLISGWRRCMALRALSEETGEARFGSVLGLVRRPQDASEAYVAMVEENEIRAGLSYYERARIVVRTVERGVFADTRTALQTLFHAASRPRRSKIGSFTTLVEKLDADLSFPHAIGERLGLKLSKALSDDPALPDRLRTALLRRVPDTPEAEQAVIERVLKGPKPSKPPAPKVTGRVRLTVDGPGRISLSGAGVTPELHAALVDWLKKNTGGLEL